MSKTLFLALACVLALCTVARADPVPPCPANKTYADYMALGVGGCLLGDKVFSNFGLRLGPNTGAATTPKANQIAVAALNAAGNPGFTFTGTPPFHSPAPPSFFSYRFTYDVRVQAGGMAIDDASLSMPAPTLAADGSLTINEMICLGAVFESKGICANNAPSVDLKVFDTPTGVKLSDSVTFMHPYRLIGTETLLIAEAGLKGSASVASFTQQFSEEAVKMPSPGTLLLLGPALAAVLVRRYGCPTCRDGDSRCGCRTFNDGAFSD
jgi:hypothetical protein